jgi:nucleotide-binding universal stress UspA family protein
MHELKRILFPVDFSDRCRGAARHAAALAAHFNSELILLHVVETPVTRPGELDFGVLAFEADLEARTKRAREMLAAFSVPGFEELQLRREVVNGDAARTILRSADENVADLILMPTHGYGVFRRFILGSVTAKVLHDAHCPVWTGVHMERVDGGEPISYQKVLCAVDGPETSARPIRAAADFARSFSGSVTAVHAVPSSEAIPERFMDRELRLDLIRDARDRIAERLDALGVTGAAIRVEPGEPARILHEVAVQEKADVLFIGRGEHRGAGRLRTHSYAIIRESPCPVISL